MKGDGGGEATWIVDAKNGKGKVEFNGKAKPDVTFTTSDADLFDLMRGELNPQKAFFAVSHKTCFRKSKLSRGPCARIHFRGNSRYPATWEWQ